MSRARLYPAGIAVTRVMSTTRNPTNAVFQSHCTYIVSKNRMRMCSSVGGMWYRYGFVFGFMRSRVSLNIVMSIQ